MLLRVGYREGYRREAWVSVDASAMVADTVPGGTLGVAEVHPARSTAATRREIVRRIDNSLGFCL